jgi:hypothetical protein
MRMGRRGSLKEMGEGDTKKQKKDVAYVAEEEVIFFFGDE